jgi:ribosomal-protein-alanine N-acetyltransferase
MDYTDLAYRTEPMRIEDIPEVMEIERVAFPTPWPARAYRHEVGQNRLAHYFVARPQYVDGAEPGDVEEESGLIGNLPRWTRRSKTTRPSVVGYCGFWIAANEAHISTIAVDPKYRSQGIGQLLLITAIERAIELGANLVSLEVRVSNVVAQNLYRKYGFRVVGRRRRYYSDNREDALIMTAEHVVSDPYQRMFGRLVGSLIERLTLVATEAPEG